MDLIQAIENIKKAISNKNYRKTQHFIEKSEIRNINSKLVERIMTKNKVLGIVQQEESQNIYKVWFYFNKNKDLNIIFKIEKDKSLKLITLFSCLSKRRKR